jgi:putative lipoic acid-binding regulatory protein
MSESDVWARIGQLLEFPVDFPIKVMGRRSDDFAQTIAALVSARVPGFDPSTIELRASSRGAWLSITLMVRAHSREQLEALYRELSAHPMVRIVL